MTTHTSIPSYVLTGGPSAGKTTGLCYLEEKLRNFGYTVFMVPEMPTLLINGGIRPHNAGLKISEFQNFVFSGILQMEELFLKAAQKSKKKKKILLYDRGIVDGKAYCEAWVFEAMLKRYNLSLPEVRDGRYDAVYHLVTAALGAEEYYTLENNTARFETAEEARRADTLTMNAWIGHPHLRIIDNSTGFEDKMKRLLREVCHSLGIPIPLEIENKYLVRVPDFSALPDHVVCVEIEQAYLTTTDPEIEKRVRKRGQDGVYVFYETLKRPHPSHPSARWEVEKHITGHDYYQRCAYRDTSFLLIRKYRHCFVWNSQYFELDVFEEPQKGMTLLEIELTDVQQEVDIPPFIEIIKDVTDDPAYKNREIARIK